MKDYIYRNDKGMEIKRHLHTPVRSKELEEEGYVLQQTIDYVVKPKEKKAK